MVDFLFLLSEGQLDLFYGEVAVVVDVKFPEKLSEFLDVFLTHLGGDVCDGDCFELGKFCEFCEFLEIEF